MEHGAKMKVCGELEIKTPKTTKNGKPYYMIKVRVTLERATYYFPFFIFGDTNVEKIENARVGCDIKIECPMKNSSYNNKDGNKVNKDFDANAFDMKITIEEPPAGSPAVDDSLVLDDDDLPF